MMKQISILFAILFLGACGSSIEGKGATGSTPCPNEGEERCTSIVSGQLGECLPRARLNECPRPTPVTTPCSSATQITCPSANGQAPRCELRATHQLCNANTPSASCQLIGATCPTPEPEEPPANGPCTEAGTISCPAEEGREASCRASSCLLYTSPSPRDQRGSRMPSSA